MQIRVYLQYSHHSVDIFQIWKLLSLLMMADQTAKQILCRVLNTDVDVLKDIGWLISFILV